MKRPAFKLKPEHALPLMLVAVVLTLTFLMTLRTKLRQPAAAPVAASAPIAASSTASDAAKDYSWVQNTQQDDILNARREAKEQVGAADIAAWENTPSAESFTAPPETLPENLPPLPATCERYYQRVDQCFAQQGEDAEALRASNQDLRVELARSNPSENECAALNRSFDTLAPTLGCR